MNINDAIAGMSNELKDRAKNCKTTEELEAFLREQNIELAPEQLKDLADDKGNLKGSCLALGRML